MAVLASVVPTALLLLLPLLLCPACAQTLRKLGQFPVDHPAFTSLVDVQDTDRPAARYSLIVSSFLPVPFSQDAIFQVTGIGEHLDNVSDVTVTEVTRGVTWPNEVHKVPDDVFNQTSYVVAAGGFLIPFKNHGSLTLFDLDFSPPVRHVLSDNSEAAKWFYHRVQWRDMNGDGLKDLVTCRAQTHTSGQTVGQMVWFEHPTQDPFSQPWTAHVITEGPDVSFLVTSLPSPEGDVDCIITAEFFSQSLNVYWSSDPQGRWDDRAQIEKRVIDNTIGNVFDVTVTDLNLDGTLDLLVTNNALANASMFAYTVPDDFRTDSFPKRVLTTGYASRTAGAGHGAPGSPVVVHPSSDTSQKPNILVSGDDDGQAYLVQPSSSDLSDWSYQQSVFLDVGTSTVGAIASADVDGDGYNEVFVPSFDEGLVYVFTFAP